MFGTDCLYTGMYPNPKMVNTLTHFGHLLQLRLFISGPTSVITVYTMCNAVDIPKSASPLTNVVSGDADF